MNWANLIEVFIDPTAKFKSKEPEYSSEIFFLLSLKSDMIWFQISPLWLTDFSKISTPSIVALKHSFGEKWNPGIRILSTNPCIIRLVINWETIEILSDTSLAIFFSVFAFDLILFNIRISHLETVALL